MPAQSASLRRTGVCPTRAFAHHEVEPSVLAGPHTSPEPVTVRAYLDHVDPADPTLVYRIDQPTTSPTVPVPLRRLISPALARQRSSAPRSRCRGPREPTVQMCGRVGAAAGIVARAWLRSGPRTRTWQRVSRRRGHRRGPAGAVRDRSAAAGLRPERFVFQSQVAPFREGEKGPVVVVHP